MYRRRNSSSDDRWRNVWRRDDNEEKNITDAIWERLIKEKETKDWTAAQRKTENNATAEHEKDDVNDNSVKPGSSTLSDGDREEQRRRSIEFNRSLPDFMRERSEISDLDNNSDNNDNVPVEFTDIF